MSTICMNLLCGLPGSGKTTYARVIRNSLHELQPVTSIVAQTDQKPAASGLAEESSPHMCGQFHSLHVCYDELLPSSVERSMIELDHRKQHVSSRTDSVYSQWKDYRRKILRCVEKTIEEIKHSTLGEYDVDTSDRVDGMTCDQREPLDEEVWRRFIWTTGCMDLWRDGITSDDKFVIIVDDNMYYRSMRYEYYQLARKYEIGFTELYIPCDTAVALARNARRLEPVADDVIITMATKMEPPDSESPFEQNCVIWKHDEPTTQNIGHIVNMLSHAMAHPVKGLNTESTVERDESRIVCSANLIHQTDRIMRKLVNNEMERFKNSQARDKDDLRDYAACLNKARSETLHYMKTDTKLIPMELELCEIHPSDERSETLSVIVERFFMQTISAAKFKDKTES